MLVWGGMSHEDGAKWHINVMELYAVVHAMRHIAHKATNACVNVQVDNTVTKGWLRKCGGTEGVPATLLRELALLLLEANSFLEVVWVASAINKRGQMHSVGRTWWHLGRHGRKWACLWCGCEWVCVCFRGLVGGGSGGGVKRCCLGHPL